MNKPQYEVNPLNLGLRGILALYFSLQHVDLMAEPL